MTTSDAHKTSVALHIGAHKTATTHLQKSLSDARPALQQAGVAYHGPESFRGDAPTLMHRFGIPHAPGAEGRPFRPTALHDLADGADRVILSEENFPGTLMNKRGRIRRPLYPDARRRITNLAERAGCALDVFLAIRQPTTFINSAFGQMMQSGTIVPLENFMRRNPIAMIDWAHLIGRLKDAPGVRSFTIWRYEDYRAVFPQVCAALTGQTDGPHIAPFANAVHRGLSVQAVEAMLHKDGLSHQDAKAAFPVGPAYPKFDAFDAEAHEVGQEFYDVQLSLIDAMDNVTRLRP